MKPIALVPALLLLALGAAPAAGQAIPAEIPDLPGESPADRAKAQLVERHRGTISRFFAGGGMDFAPVTGHGPAYQASFALGLYRSGGDAILVTLSALRAPGTPAHEIPQTGERGATYFGIGYAIPASRFLSRSPIAERGSLRLGVGVMHAEVSAIALELTPSYDVLTGSNWAVPVGLKLSYALFGNGEMTLSRPFVGIGVGLRLHFGGREKLE